MFRWPGTIQAADRPELGSSIDIVPTILAASEAEGPHDFPGLNLLPALTSGDTIGRDAIFGESFAHDIADIENPQASLLYRWVIRGHTKFLLTYDGAQGKMDYSPKSAAPQLYDLKADPGENVNLAEAQSELVSQLGALISDWYPVTERKVGVLAQPAAATRRKSKNNETIGSAVPP